MPSPPELIHANLLTLLAVARRGTFAKAASELRITPSAVSHRIKALEKELGFELFERRGGASVLTPAAAKLVERLRPAYSAINDALKHAGAERHDISGVVRLGGPAPFFRAWVLPKLAPLVRSTPGLLLHLRFEVPSILEARLAAGEYDLCVLASPATRKSVETEPLHTEEFVAVASPAFIASRRALETEQDFASQRYIAFDEDCAMLAPWWRVHFGRTADLPRHIACYVADLGGMLVLAEQGVGIAVLPRLLVENSLANARVHELRPKSPGTRAAGRQNAARNVLFLAWRESAVETAPVKAVRRALHARTPEPRSSRG